MHIGIIGTRGIPNQHGGFEQFAEFVAPELVSRGHQVVVYNSSTHPYTENEWKGVKIIRGFDPEKKIGTAGQFIYDLNCILDSRKRKFDVILQLGYTSSSVWTFLYPGKPVLITNMDGLEWKRSKYSRMVQRFLKKAERWAALYSDKLIADSRGIQDYLSRQYNKPAAFISYGATLFDTPDPKIIERYNLVKYSYNLLIARMEPENSVEEIILAHREAGTSEKLILIGAHTNAFGSYLKKKYESDSISFLGAVYDLDALNNLRYFSHLYFHGHSVGGTNPSLLEAMASQALIVAHDNVFNRGVLEKDAFYFSSAADLATFLKKDINKSAHAEMIENNRFRIANYYSWKYVTDGLEKYFSEALYGTK